MPRDIRSENLMNVLNVQVDIIWPFEKIIINKYLENKRNIKILDVGCGNGSFEEKLIILLEEKNINYEIIGIDLDKDSIELAKKINLNNTNFSISDVNNLQFDSNYFDLVITRHTFCFIKDHKKAIEEILRVLKPNGIYHFLVDDYNMFFHSLSSDEKINDLYNKGWIEYFNNVGNKLGFGANIPKILKNLNINNFHIEYIVIDNINSDNKKIIKFNKNMKNILLSVYQYSNLSKEEADNYYDKIINDITFENGFFMWTIPVISGNKYI